MRLWAVSHPAILAAWPDLPLRARARDSAFASHALTFSCATSCLPRSLAMTSISVPEPVMSLAVAPKAR